ncbi:hypothetical protein AUK05_03000 [Candidatus Shapirobacteria bacterium CG2_30_35_20]|nr:MAG: hypothetical protein AUK05_03000 [Candidatus Shapirobacteria bacterium CG2_30_35_20]
MNMKKYSELIKNYSIKFLIKAFWGEIKRKIWREYIYNSYSQNYEDLILKKYFNLPPAPL